MSRKLFKELEAVFNEHLVLDSDPAYLKVVFGTILANRLNTHPVWLMIIARASSGKSEVACSTHLCGEIFIASKLNKKSFISHVPRSKENPQDPSLLPKLNGKVLVIPDMSTLSTLHPNERAEVFAILRSAFDGEYSDSSGMGTKTFKSKFGVMACATPIFEYSKTFDSSLGERFIHFRPRTSNPDSAVDIWEKVKTSGNAYTEMKDKLAYAAMSFLDNIKEPNKILYPDEIFALAQMLAVLRTEVVRDTYSREVAFPVSQGELPIRVGKQLCALFTGLCLFSPEGEALNIIKRVVRDSIPYVRLYILYYILEGCRTSECLSKKLKLSPSSTRRALEEMSMLNILKYRESPNEKGVMFYSISSVYKDLFSVKVG